MTDLILDASVVMKWFSSPDERHSREARDLRDRYAMGKATVTVPSLLFLEILNVAGRRWGWDQDALALLASSLDDLGFDVGEAELAPNAAWTSRGLTAYDAAYVALAESRGLPLITDDERIVSVAPDVARPLAQDA